MRVFPVSEAGRKVCTHGVVISMEHLCAVLLGLLLHTEHMWAALMRRI